MSTIMFGCLQKRAIQMVEHIRDNRLKAAFSRKCCSLYQEARSL